MIGELFSNMSRISGQKAVAEKWSQSGLQFSDIINLERESVDEIVKNYVSLRIFKDNFVIYWFRFLKKWNARFGYWMMRTFANK